MFVCVHLIYTTKDIILFSASGKLSAGTSKESKCNSIEFIVKTPSLGLVVSTNYNTEHTLLFYIDEGSLSSERLQYSAAPVQRVGTPSAGEDNQVRTRRGKFTAK